MPSFVVGEKVKIKYGMFEGMIGTVHKIGSVYLHIMLSPTLIAICNSYELEVCK